MDISKTLLQQRIRNRIINNLESFADTNWVNKLGTNEIINMWYDHMDEEETFELFSDSVFTNNEMNSIKRFHNLIESSYEKIPTTWKQEDLQGNTEWSMLVETAKEELNIFMERGRFSEEQEIT